MEPSGSNLLANQYIKLSCIFSNGKTNEKLTFYRLNLALFSKKRMRYSGKAHNNVITNLTLVTMSFGLHQPPPPPPLAEVA